MRRAVGGRIKSGRGGGVEEESREIATAMWLGGFVEGFLSRVEGEFFLRVPSYYGGE